MVSRMGPVDRRRLTYPAGLRLHDQHPVAEEDCLLDVVGDEDPCQPPRRPDPLQLVLHLDATSLATPLA